MTTPVIRSWTTDRFLRSAQRRVRPMARKLLSRNYLYITGANADECNFFADDGPRALARLPWIFNSAFYMRFLADSKHFKKTGFRSLKEANATIESLGTVETLITGLRKLEESTAEIAERQSRLVGLTIGTVAASRILGLKGATQANSMGRAHIHAHLSRVLSDVPGAGAREIDGEPSDHHRHILLSLIFWAAAAYNHPSRDFLLDAVKVESLNRCVQLSLGALALLADPFEFRSQVLEAAEVARAGVIHEEADEYASYEDLADLLEQVVDHVDRVRRGRRNGA